MSEYKLKINPFTGSFQYVTETLTFKTAVASVSNLPVTGNEKNDARLTNDTQRLYVWDGDSWNDQGDILDIDWSVITNKPSSMVVNIDDAVSKKHSNNLDHTQGTDQGLDTGGINAVTAAQAKTGYSHSQVAHAPSNAVSLATVKADSDIDDALDKKHSNSLDHVQGSDHVILNEQLDNYILVLTDDGKLIDMNKSTAVTLTVPKNSSVIFPIGTIIAIRQKGVGKVTITPIDGDVTINNPDGLKTTNQYAVATIVKIDTNTWTAFGSFEV